MRDNSKMRYIILRWLLGIWLVETVVARHIHNEEDTGNKQSRLGRDQFHPFYQQSPHLNYNSFRSSLRRAPPQVPSRRNLIEQDGSNDQQYYNYFAGNHPSAQNQPNVNLFSAVRLHGALETRARNEPGTETLVPTTQHVNYFHPQQHQDVYSRRPANRHWRRDDEDAVDGESFEREDDLARFSLYNSYFDNEHSIKALNSMKCVTPTGSAGFCSTFRGCVPSFFTKDGDLEAPALAELISTSIGYCTTNVSHHFIREQKQFVYASSREERRFNSVANRIICCPGIAPDRDPSHDPDKIFNDYIESQKQKTSTTTAETTTTTLATTAGNDSPSESSLNDSEAVPPQDATGDVTPEENIVNDGENSIPEGSQSASVNQPVQLPVNPPTDSVPEGPTSSPEQTQNENEPANLDESHQPQQDSSTAITHPDESGSNMVNHQQVEQGSSPSTLSPEGMDDALNQTSVDFTSQAPIKESEGSVTEAISLPESLSTTEQTSQQPIEQESTSVPTSHQPPSNDMHLDSPAESSTSPGSEQPSPGKFPPKTQDSNIIKIYPEPVSGVNGKFTLPGGIYIYSTSTDTPNNHNHPKPASPSGEQVVGGVSSDDETIVGSKPIIIVTNPGSMPDEKMPPMVPHFPSDFPPMGSQENPVPPAEDSSLELQQRPRPQIPIDMNLGALTSSTPYPSSTSQPVSELIPTTLSSGNSNNEIVNDEQQQSVVATTTDIPVQYPISGHSETQTTTFLPQQDEVVGAVTTQQIPVEGHEDNMQNQQNDEGEMPIITTSQPQLSPVVVLDENANVIPLTTGAPVLNDDEEEGNDAVTIVPIYPISSEKSPQSSSIITGSDIPTTMKPMSNIMGQEEQEDVLTTVPSVSGVAVQEVELTTRQAPETVSNPQDSGFEATTIVAEKQQQQITTLAPDSDESEESNEEKPVTAVPAEAEADMQETTVSPVSSDIFAAPTTTVVPVSHGSLAGVETSQEDENVPVTTTPSGALQQSEIEGVTTVGIMPTLPEEIKTPGIMNHLDNEPMVPGVQDPTSMPVIQLEPSNDSTVPPRIILSPGSESVDNELETGSLPALPSEPVPVNDENGQIPVSDGLQPFPDHSPASAGDAGESEQQQYLPASDSSANPQEPSNSVPTSPSISEPSNDPIISTESPALAPSSTDSQPQSDGGSDQSTPSNEAGASSESSSPDVIGVTAGVSTTGYPVGSSVEQDAVSELGIPTGQPNRESGSEHTSTVGPSTSESNSESDLASGTEQQSTDSGNQSIPSGSESSPNGSASNASGPQSTSPGSESGSPEFPNQSDEPYRPECESLVTNVPTTTTEYPSGISSSSQSSDKTSDSTQISNAIDDKPSSMEPIVPEQPTSVPENDQPASDDNSNSNDEFTNNAVTDPSSPVPSTNTGPSTTQDISQEPVPSVSSDTAEDASPVQGSAPQADSPVSSDIMQDPQPVSSTSEVSQDVSSPASIGSSSEFATTQPSTTAASADQLPEDIQSNYQILKACKFQSFFRSVNDMTYSYRHYPWLATIVGGTRPFSSGTLITDRHILTASHFLANITVSDVFNMRIHIGYRTSYSGQTEGPYAVRKVRKVIRHKGFSFEKLYNDIAVLVLDRPVRFSEDIYPVCISSNRSTYSNGTVEAFETGWIEDPRTYTISHHHNYVDPHILKYFSFGYKNITWRLQEAPQRVRTNAECQSNYSFLEKNGIMVTDSMVCAGSGDTRSCAFRGNSGAPLFLRNENDRMTEQIGIVSFGIGCGHFPFVFTRVESFLPWLDRVVYNSR